MNNSYISRARQLRAPQENQLRTRKQATQLLEGKPLPLRVLNCTQGKNTSQGKGTWRLELQHLKSQEIFTSIVVEDVAPEYIDIQIVDAILPPGVETYGLKDLIDGGILATLEFNRHMGRTFVNIIHVEPLSDDEQEILENLIAKEQKSQQGAKKQNIGAKTETKTNHQEDEEEIHLENDEDGIDFDIDDIDEALDDDEELDDEEDDDDDI